MPRIDFRDLVSDILVEQDPSPVTQQLATPPNWFTDAISAYKSRQGTEYPVDDNKLQNIFSVAIKRPSQSDVKQIGLPYIHIHELIHDTWKALDGHSKINKWNEYLTELVENKTTVAAQKIATDLTARWKQQQGGMNKEDIISGEFNNLYDKNINEIASLGEKALQGDGELSNSSVIDAVQKIVNRRIGVFTRMAKLKSPKQPFTILINDIFKTPELYLTGSKKYSSDFAAVDKLYISDLIKVAIAAKEFYADEVVKLKTQPPEQSPDDPQGRLPGFENTSLNLYDTFVNSVLVEMALRSNAQVGRDIASGAQAPVRVMGTKYPGGPFSSQEYNRQFDDKLRQAGQEPESYRNQEIGQEPSQQQASKTINTSIIKQLEDKALQDIPNRIRFLTGMPVQYLVVDETGKDTQQKGVIDSSKEYNIGNILKINSTKSQNLINALGSIAQYSKTRLGAGEMASRTAGALGALRTGIGPVG